MADLAAAPADGMATQWLQATRQDLFGWSHIAPYTSEDSVCLPNHVVEGEAWFSGASDKPQPPVAPPPLAPPAPPEPPAGPLAPPPITPFDFGYQNPTLKTSPDDCLLMPNAANCRLEQELDYCTVVQAVNEHGLVSAKKRSSGVRICHQPPVGGVVFEVTNTSSADADYTGSDHLLVQWDQVGILQDSNLLPRTFLQLR